MDREFYAMQGELYTAEAFGHTGLPVPGRYVLVDHALTRMERGLVGALLVEGPANPDIFRNGDGTAPAGPIEH